VILNAHWEDHVFQIAPPPEGTRWYRVLDTSLPPPLDFVEPGCEEPIERQDHFRAAPRSSVVLMAK
jgi:glycogen operon protein